ncbi:prenyltransferase/squalene oxidase repeat-containing protein [Immundisolibacter sp.]
MMETRQVLHVPVSALTRAHAYLMGRQCANGSFSFYRSEYLEEPNMHDTWHALSALCLLGTSVPRTADITRYIIGQPVLHQPYALMFRVRSLRLLASPDPQHAAVRAAAAALTAAVPDLERPGDPSDTLYRLRLVLWLKRYFGLDFPAQDIARILLASEHPGGGFGRPPNLLVTRQILAVLALCNAYPSTRTATFVTGLASPGSGFRLTEQSLSPNLETTCAGVSCCHRLGVSIPHATDALTFILDCQTGGGGFARAPGALPDLELTHLALSGLTVLAGALRPAPHP